MSVIPSHKSTLIVIFAVAFLARMMFAFFVVGIDSPIGFDEVQYESAALNLVQGNGYINERSGHLPAMHSYRMPLYSLFLAANFSLFGFDYVPVRIIQNLIGAFICVQIFLIAALLVDRRAAVLAGWMAALYPNFLRWSNWIATETLFMALILAVVYLSISGVKKERLGYFAAAGICGGLALLTHPTALPMLCLLPIYFWFALRKSIRKQIQISAALFLPVILLLLPWVYRNYQIHEQFVPLTTSTGINLWRAAGPGAKGGGVNRFADKPVLPAHLSETEWDATLKALAVREIEDAPVRYLAMMPGRFLWMWHLSPHLNAKQGLKAKAEEILFLSIYYPLLLFSLIGLWTTRHRWRALLPLYFLIVSFTVVHLFFISAGRYRLPAMPAVMIFASAGLVWSFGRTKARERLNARSIAHKDASKEISMPTL